jgi:hypothetical protein
MSGSVALAAATAKTVMFVLGSSDHGVELKKFRIGFDGVTSSAVPVLWELNYLTAATNSVPGTGNTSATASIQQSYGRTIANSFLAGINCTAEPTVQANADANLLTPNGGLLPYDYPWAESPDSAAAQGFCLRLTAPAVVNVRVGMWFERI